MRYRRSCSAVGCSEGSSVNDHVLKMINLIETSCTTCFLTWMGELSQDLVLQSLPGSFSQFVVNFSHE